MTRFYNVIICTLDSSHVVLSPGGLGVSAAGRFRQVCAYTTSSREAVPIVTDGHQVHK
jgi:hypothetical protein